MPKTVISPVRQHHLVLPEISPDTMGPVREILRTLLRMWQKSDLSFVAELGVTELLTNVWKHAPGACELLVRDTSDGIMVGVTDFDDALPVMREPQNDAECGRGLRLLSELAEELHARPLLIGKQVWFRLSQPPEDNNQRGATPPQGATTQVSRSRVPLSNDAGSRSFAGSLVPCYASNQTAYSGSRCELTDLLPSNCAHCLGTVPDHEHPIRTSLLLSLSGWVCADRTGRCVACGDVFPVGAAIVEVTGGWRADCCPGG